jgi:hypothetical protein
LIHYSVGNEHSPMDFAGRFELTVDADGRACLEHVERHRTRHFEGRADRLDTLHAALARAGFPQQDWKPIVPDTRMCTIRAGEAGVQVPWRDARYAEPIALLDSIVAELSE